jgi:hypothetical protein
MSMAAVRSTSRRQQFALPVRREPRSEAAGGTVLRFPAAREAGVETPANSEASAGEVARLLERFEDLTWQSCAAISTVVVTLVIGVLACGQLLAFRM